MKTECGIIACFTENTITKEDLYNTLSAIQHRGQDSYGYISIKPKTKLERELNQCNNTNSELNITEVKEKGLLPDISNLKLDTPDCGVFLGHMRYSTNTATENLDASLLECNFQPVEICQECGIYIAHNGNLPNLKVNMSRLGLNGYKNGMNDTYLFRLIWNHLFKKKDTQNISIADIIEYLKYILMHIVGSYSCVLTYYKPASNKLDSSSSSGTSSSYETESSYENTPHISEGQFYLFGIRDRIGYKPLSMGKIKDNYCFFSESVQLARSIDYIGDVNAGEIWMLTNSDRPIMIGRAHSKTIDGSNNLCSLEAIYFMKRDTILFNGDTTVNNFRRRIGIELAKKDIDNFILASGGKLECVNSGYYEAQQELKKRDVLYMPESAHSIAMGYSEMIGSILRGDLISKVENIRSFIESTTEAREGKLKRKFAFDDKGIADLKEIVLIDDTIVRGNSMRYMVDELHKRNPQLIIHIRIGSPRLIKGCSFGIDLYDDELIACKEPDLVQYLGNGVTSVEFLDISTLGDIFKRYGMGHCGYCFGNISDFNKKTLEW
jgi:glutamine phosphoribosylpyrophosphate amidotransferase